MKKILAIGLIAGLAAVAMADKTIPGHAKAKAPRGVDGSGGTAAGTIYYDNTEAPYGYIWYLTAVPKEILDDGTFTGGPAAGVGGNVDSIIVGWIELGAGPINFDIAIKWWDDCDTTNSNTPINAGELDTPGYTLLVRNVAAPGAYQSLRSLAALPGGGVDMTDDNDWGISYVFYEPGSTSVISNQGSPIFDYDNSGPSVGTNEDIGWSDTLGNVDGVYDPADGFFAGGAPFYTALWLEMEGNPISNCIPCDTDCNGSVNGQDIQPFIDILNGGAGCAPCSGDADGNGTVNGQDIQAFIACLAP
jgi:hypothetical protein